MGDSRPAFRLWFSSAIIILSFCLPDLTLAQSGIFERNPAPFPVLQADGNAYSFPFLGGFNVPRPQFVDIDGDGDDDLFVQEKSNQLIFFERVPTSDGVPFVRRSEAYQDLEIGEWYRFADLDGDGDQDLLAEQPFSFVRVYENTGTSQVPVFQLAIDMLLDNLGAPLFAERQNIPNLVDIDNDGLIDLFTGQLDGTIAHYEQTADTGIDELSFTLQSDRFQDISIVNSFAKHTGERHGANTLTFFDIDEDGDIDLFWGDFFEPGLLFFENRGSENQPQFENTPLGFPLNAPVSTSGYNAPSFGKLDGDDRVDLVVGVLGGAFSALSSSADNLLYYRQDDAGQFILETERLLSNIDAGSDSYPVLYDVDRDGDLDLVLGNSIDPQDPLKANLTLSLNEGEQGTAFFTVPVEIPVEPAFNYAPAFGDLNNDGFDDLIVGSFRGAMDLYWNTGQEGMPQYTLGESDFLDIPSGSNSTPFLVDLDGDSDLDLLVGQSSGILNFFRNIGNPSTPVFTLETSMFEDIDVGRRSAPFARDFDGDGDYDLVIGSDQDGLQAFENTGTPQLPDFEQVDWFDIGVFRRMVPAFGDLDGDTDLDILIGGLEGGVQYFENKEVEVIAIESPGQAHPVEMVVFPNPLTGFGSLEIRNLNPGVLSIQLFDAMGRDLGEVYRSVNARNLLRTPINLSEHPAGVYFIKIQSGGRAFHQMVVKI